MQFIKIQWRSFLKFLKKDRFSDSTYEYVVKPDKGIQNRGLFQLWLQRDDVTVGYIHYRVEANGLCDACAPVVDVWEVETRPGYRKQGISRKLAETVKNHVGIESLVSVGGFTPEGFDYFSKYCDKVESRSETHIYGQSSFVKDWDEQIILPPREI